jgi:2-dehydropantoate 2-reductase
MTTVGVLGVGGVGGMLAVRLAVAGHRVVCVARRETAAAIRDGGIELTTPDEVTSARPDAVERLAEPVSLLVVAVKAPDLPDALERIEVFSVADGVVVPLLNGLEHPEVVRRRLGPRVAPGSIAHFQAHAVSAGRIVQQTGRPLVTVASDDVARPDLERAVACLPDAGVDVAVAADERAVLWEKLARLGPLAAATAVSGRTVGELREDPAWRPRLEAAVTEACAAAAADGVAVDPAAELAIVDSMRAALTTSTARDIAAGRPSELDAIVGSILRAAGRSGVDCPVLAELFEEARTA